MIFELQKKKKKSAIARSHRIHLQQHHISIDISTCFVRFYPPPYLRRFTQVLGEVRHCSHLAEKHLFLVRSRLALHVARRQLSTQKPARHIHTCGGVFRSKPKRKAHKKKEQGKARKEKKKKKGGQKKYLNVRKTNLTKGVVY